MFLNWGSLVPFLVLGASALSLPPLPESLRQEMSFAGQDHVTADLEGHQLPRHEWTISVDGEHPGKGATSAIDGDERSVWETEHSSTYPHFFIIDMKREHNVSGISYLPRQDGSSQGNIGRHNIFLSRDGVNFADVVAYGNFRDDHHRKNVSFPAKTARFVRFDALDEAADRVSYASMAEFHVYESEKAATPAPAYSVGQWGPTINFPIVPAAAALDVVSGNILTWAAYTGIEFLGSNFSQTVTATYNPSTGAVSREVVTNTDHDMFCPGIAQDSNGNTIVNGGRTANHTSIYDPTTNSWTEGPLMNIARGYESTVTTSDGRQFTLGGSWSGGLTNPKNGEIFDGSSWTLLPGCPVQPMLTADRQGIYRQDNHGWFFAWSNGNVFQA